VDILKSQISAIVGSDNVVTEPAELEPYYKGSIGFIPERPPLMAVKPGNDGEIKAILKTAAIHKTPLTPFSSNKNGHGASIPDIPGITIDLRRLNHILSFDENARNAVVEPGVTFAQLQKVAKEKGLKVLTPIDLPADDSSVLSSYLEMAPLYAWPKFGPETLLNIEMMIPSGDVIKTGSTYLPIMADKQSTPIFHVPALVDKMWFGAQGTFGIATKGTVRLKTAYEDQQVLFIPFNSFMECAPVLQEIRRIDAGIELFLANPAYLAGLLCDDGDAYDKLKQELPPVTGVLVLSGEKERTEYQRLDLLDLAKKMNFKIEDALPGDANAAEKLLAEIESPQGYNRFEKLKGAYNVIPFMAMAMQLPIFSMVLGQMAGAFKYDPNNIGQMLLPVEPSRFHFQYSFYSDPTNPQDHFLVKKFYEVFSSTLIKMGGFFSRPYGDWAAQVYSKATAYKAIVKETKAVLDPDNIMNPGKLDL
jgi:FAD/FMN-containing dehydrogenase